MSRLCLALAFFLAGCATQRYRLLPGDILQPPRGNSQSTSALYNQRYGHYMRDGFVELRSPLRLKVLAPLMKPGSTSGPLRTEATQTGERQLTLEAKAAEGLLGYEITRYSLQPVSVLSVERNYRGKVESAPAPSRDYLRIPPEPLLFRLFFLTRVSQADHNIALLGARSQPELETLTHEFMAQTAKDCSAFASRGYCLLAPPELAITPEMQIDANGKSIWIPLGGRVRDVLAAEGQQFAGLSKLSVLRPYRNKLVPVQFDSSKPDILNLTLIGGERLSW